MKKKKGRKPTMMERARAARAMLDAMNGPDRRDAELEAFMSIFHPEKFADRKFMHKLKQKD